MEWIKCDDRLPDERGSYLVSSCNDVWIAEFHIFKDAKSWLVSATRPSIKAWMPLPKPFDDGIEPQKE